MTSTHELVRQLGALGLVWPDRVSVASAKGGLLEPEQRAIWQRVVRKAYGVSALKAGFAMFGRGLALADLAHISNEALQWQARVTEGAGLAPLIAPLVKMRQAPPASYQGLRANALALGLTSLGWKWLCRQRPALVAKLFAFGWTAEAIWWVNLLAKARGSDSLSASWLESGRPYLQQGTYEWVACCPPGNARHAADLYVERFFRLVPSEATAQHLAEFELVTSAVLAGLRTRKNRVSVAPGRTWPNVLETVRRVNQAREARAQQLALERAATLALQEQARDTAWKAQIGSGQLQQVMVTELLTERDLVNEGCLMDHCVGNGGYLASCATGQHLVMSLKEPITNARATLQLVKSASKSPWHIGQLAGPANSTVPQVFWKVARSLAAGVRPSARPD